MSSGGSAPKFVWYAALGIIIALVIYNLYSGLVANEIGIPGVFTAKFGQKQPGMNPDQGSQPSGDDVAKQQKALQDQLAQMREELAKQKTKPPQLQTTNIAGTWYGAGNLYYIINQNGNALEIQEVNPNIGGISAAGRGWLNQQDVDISYSTVQGTSGRALLKVSDDGHHITGTFTDLNFGTTMPANLSR